MYVMHVVVYIQFFVYWLKDDKINATLINNFYDMQDREWGNVDEEDGEIELWKFSITYQCFRRSNISLHSIASRDPLSI